MMIDKYFKRWSLYFFKASFIALGIGSILILALVIRLHQGPLSLEIFRTTLQKKIEKLAPDFRFTLRHPEMVWEGLDHPLKIHFREIEIKHRSKLSAGVSIGALALTYNLLDLLTKGFEPAGLEIQSPHFTADEKELSSFLTMPQEKSLETETSFSLVQNLLHSPLKLLKINQAQIIILHPDGKEIWAAPSTNIVVKRTSGDIEVNASTLGQNQNFSFLFTYRPTSQESRFSLSLPYISSSLLKNIPDNHFKNAPELVKKFVSVFRMSNLNFSLKFDGHYHPEKGIESGSFELNSSKGRLDLPNLLPKPLPFQEAKLKAIAQNNLITIEACQVKLEKKTVNVKGTALWDAVARSLTYDLLADATHVTVDSLKDIWPLSLAPLPRQWVLTHISKAVFPHAECAIKGEASLGASSLSNKLNHLQGKIEFVNGNVTYMDQFPAVEDVNGTATYNKRDFKIHLTRGKSAGLTLAKGQIDIQGLDQEDQTLNLKLEIASSLPEIFRFIDSPPLRLAQKYNMNKLNSHGEALTTLGMFFPLSSRLQLSHIRTQVDSRLSNVSLIKPIEALDVSVAKGEIFLTIDAHKALLQGSALLNDAPSQILWERALSDKNPHLKKLKVDVAFTPLWLKSIGFNSPFPFTGSVPAQVSYVENREHKGTLEITADLSPAEIEILGWTKYLKNKGSLSIVLDFQNDIPQILRKFFATSARGLKIEGDGMFDPFGKNLKSFKLHTFVAGKNQFHGTLTQDRYGRYNIHVNGSSLNMEPLLKAAGDKEYALPETGLVFKAQLDKLHLDSQATLFDNSLNFHSKKGRLVTLDYTSYLRMTKKKETLIHAAMTSLPNHTRRLTLQTPAAGKLLKAFGFPLKFYGGLLQLYAIHNDTQKQDRWNGKLRIQDFSLKDAPVLGQILSLAFPTGMVDLFSDKGLSFQQFRTHFSLSPRKLVISKGRAQGASLGITVQGAVDRSLNTIHLSGSVIPAYVLNSLLSKIPLLGEIITGGKHEGIFSVSYAIEGSRSKPKVSVNPVSLLTPGFLRKIFESDAHKDQDEEDLSFDLEGEESKINP